MPIFAILEHVKTIFVPNVPQTGIGSVGAAEEGFTLRLLFALCPLCMLTDVSACLESASGEKVGRLPLSLLSTEDYWNQHYSVTVQVLRI